MKFQDRSLVIQGKREWLFWCELDQHTHLSIYLSGQYGGNLLFWQRFALSDTSCLSKYKSSAWRQKGLSIYLKQ